MKEIKVYTKKFCPFCENLKMLLKSMNLDFEEIKVRGDEDFFIEISEKYSHFTVPKIFIGDKFVGGYDSFVNLKKNNKLEELLN